jgi:hypothetical protein
MAGCELDFSSLPILTGCPGNNETFLVGNAIGGLDVNGMPTVGYARRMWSDMLKCVLSGLTWFFSQSTVGQVGSVIADGSTQIVLSVPNFISDSLAIFLGGGMLPRNDNTQISYTYVYNSGTGVLTITFNQAAQDDQQYILVYALS